MSFLCQARARWCLIIQITCIISSVPSCLALFPEQECAFLPALALLARLPPTTWQPCHLLHLFPATTSHWLHDVPPLPALPTAHHVPTALTGIHSHIYT